MSFGILLWKPELAAKDMINFQKSMVISVTLLAILQKEELEYILLVEIIVAAGKIEKIM